MLTARCNADVSIAGLEFTGTLHRTANGWRAHSIALPAGTAGTLTNRGSDTAGTATLEDGHGLQTNDVIAVFWNGGRRHGIICTVAGNAISVAGGAGDVLPAEDTVVVVTKMVQVTNAFDGDDLQAIVVGCDQRVCLDFRIAGPASLAVVGIPAGEIWQWAADQAIANPLTGDPVTGIYAYNGSSTTAAILKVGLLLDSTP